MKIGLFGLPKTGKTTLFNALTKSRAQVADYTVAKAEPNIAIVKVGDPRVTRLSEMYKPKKTTYATIEFVDFVGVSEGAIKDEDAFPTALMKLIRSVDALALVARAFQATLAARPVRSATSRRSTKSCSFAILSFLKKDSKKSGPDTCADRNQTPCSSRKKCSRKSSNSLISPFRSATFHLTKKKRPSYGIPISYKKAAIAVINSNESSFGTHTSVLEELGKVHKAVEFAGSFEMELSRLEDPNETKMFMEDMGIKESARDLLTAAAYETLGYISFFTVGADEVRAWNIHRGSSAVAAAAAIHTDLARGFIAAECFSYADLLECGSEKAIKDKGRFKLEGKDYVVKDGDI